MKTEFAKMRKEIMEMKDRTKINKVQLDFIDKICNMQTRIVDFLDSSCWLPNIIATLIINDILYVIECTKNDEFRINSYTFYDDEYGLGHYMTCHDAVLGNLLADRLTHYGVTATELNTNKFEMAVQDCDVDLCVALLCSDKNQWLVL